MIFPINKWMLRIRTTNKPEPYVLLIGESCAVIKSSFVCGGRRFVKDFNSLNYVTILNEDGTTSGSGSRLFTKWEALK